MPIHFCFDDYERFDKMWRHHLHIRKKDEGVIITCGKIPLFSKSRIILTKRDTLLWKIDLRNVENPRYGETFQMYIYDSRQEPNKG